MLASVFEVNTNAPGRESIIRVKFNVTELGSLVTDSREFWLQTLEAGTRPTRSLVAVCSLSMFLNVTASVTND